MDPTFLQNLHGLLQQATAPDTNAIKAATATLNKEYYKNPQCIPALFEIIATSPNEAVRQLAAVELRKRINAEDNKLWIALPQEIRNAIKEKSLQVVLNESKSLVRHSTARAVSAIANFELPLSQWPELLAFLEHSCNSQAAAHREVGVYILQTILETIVEQPQYAKQTPNFMQLFGRLLQDPESLEVRVTTIRCLGIMAEYLGESDKEDIKTYANYLPGMITVLGQCISDNDEGNARHIFDVLETLLILEAPVIGRHTGDFVQAFVQWANDKNVVNELRVMSLNSLNWVVKYKKSKIQSQNMAPQIIQSLIPAIGEPEDDLDGESVYRAALRVLDELALKLPPSQVFPPLLSIVQNCITSPDPAFRRAGLLALGVAVEGCSDFMQAHMPAVWPILEAGFNDPEPIVRKASCNAICSLCEYLEEECVAKHSVLVPGLLHLMGDEATQKDATTALDSLLEALPEVIEQYLPVLMERFVILLDNAPVKVKTLVAGAIGSAAHAARDKFLVYFAPIMQKFDPYLSLPDEGDEGDLRGMAIDAIGTFAEAVGKESFAPFFQPMMAKSFEALETTKSPRLRECCFLLWGVLARVFEDEFAGYLPRCLPPLLKSCKQHEIGEEVDEAETGQTPADAIVVEEDDLLGDEDIDGAMIEVNSALTVEKEIAVDTLGTLFVATKNAFLPFVEECTLVLVEMLDHYYEGIRKAGTNSLLEFVQTFYKLSNPQPWTPGISGASPLHSNVKDMCNHALTGLLAMYQTEDDKEVVTTLFSGLAETLTLIGPAFIDGSSIPRAGVTDNAPVATAPVPHIDTIVNMVVQVLDKKSLCQNDPDEETSGAEAEEEQAELDSVLIQAAGDLVAGLAVALGPDFGRLFVMFFPKISKYYKKKSSLMDRSSAIGVLAEILAGMKSAVTPFTQDVLQLLGKALVDPEPEVVNNACFAVGLVIEHSEVDLSSQYLPLLGTLRPLFAPAEGSKAPVYTARDNAAGAVARMIIRNSAAVPLDQVLPVIIGILPLEADPIENKTVFRALLTLFHTNAAPVMAHIDALLPAIAKVLDPSGEDNIGDEVRAGLIEVVSRLNQQDPGKIQAAGLSAFVR
ncbi:ARM repeat-containing protein [Auricularia subglabra TFB-10046 SS5]|nr:ARM repeat-containing protein [Auricularia subglabra TFB-10046 SS5]